MRFIGNADFEPSLLDFRGFLTCEVVRENEDAGIGAPRVGAFLEELNVFGAAEGRDPLRDFILPCVAEGGRCDDEQGPVLFVNVGNSESLNCLTYSHFIT